MAASPLSDDEVLLQRYRAGSVDAFNELVLRHSRALFSYIRGMVGQQEDAEDVFQDTWARVIRHEASFRGGTVRGWIWRIAKNAVIDRVRRRKPDDSLDRPIGEDGLRLGDQIAAAGLPVPDQVDGNDLGIRIAACVAGLPPAQREVFLMRTTSGLSFGEIAKILDVPLNTALGRMHYAVTHLRDALADEWRDR
jgi:RNA polymerase sigma-70 factor (ECF subfamily)